MDNSKISNDSVSMYYSFNATIQLEDTLEEKMVNSIENMSLADHQNSTLEANDLMEMNVKTVIKKSPLVSFPKNILQEYRPFSSTPTKLPEKSEFLKPKIVDDLGIAFLDAPQERIGLIQEDKENFPVASLVVPAFKAGISKATLLSDKVNSVVDSPQNADIKSDEAVSSKKAEQQVKKRASLKLRKSLMPSEPDLRTNKPSRIANSRKSIFNPAKEIPKKTAFLKPFKEAIKPSAIPVKPTVVYKHNEPSNIPLGNLKTKPENDLISKPIKKPTLLNPATLGRRQTIISNSKRKVLSPILSRRSVLPLAATGAGRRSVFPVNLRRSAVSKISVASTSSSSNPSIEPPTKLRKSTSFKKLRFVAADPVPVSTIVHTSVSQKPTNPVKKEYRCNICLQNFDELSSLQSHKKTHITTSSNRKQTNQCQFCDKKFAIAKALSNHLLMNCPKIPPHEKKKLLLPQRSPLPPIKSHLVSKSSFNNLDDLSSSSSSRGAIPKSGRKPDLMPPPSSSLKIKKKMPLHSGIYRTPTKLINCDKCDQQFSHILSYSEHCSSHFSNSNISESSLSQSQSSVESQTTAIESISEYTQTSPSKSKKIYYTKPKTIKKQSSSLF